MKNAVVQGYANDADRLIPQYESLSSAQILAPVAHLIPSKPSRILDIGAGTGRDAAWYADRGHEVWAVEPVSTLRSAATSLHRSKQIHWLDDSLPSLALTLSLDLTFDLVTLCSVWQHLDAHERQTAMSQLRALVAPHGYLVVSVRHGPGSPSRPCFDACAEEAIDLAQSAGFQLVCRKAANSVQAGNRAAGVTWTWLAFSPQPKL